MTDMLKDYLIIDGSEESDDPFEYYAALQRQINNGQVWLMQGSCGSAAMDAIRTGKCLCGHYTCRDFYGNTVPSRKVLEPGTKGTYDFVRENSGLEWADKMAAIDSLDKIAA